MNNQPKRAYFGNESDDEDNGNDNNNDDEDLEEETNYEIGWIILKNYFAFHLLYHIPTTADPDGDRDDALSSPIGNEESSLPSSSVNIANQNDEDELAKWLKAEEKNIEYKVETTFSLSFFLSFSFFLFLSLSFLFWNRFFLSSSLLLIW